MKTSQKGLDLIMKWEGCVLSQYICPAGKPTIGYGHVVLPGEKFPAKITKEEAVELLKKDVARFELAIEKHITAPLNQNQFDALVCFLFNVGEGGIIKTGVQRELNAGNFAAVPTKLLEWCKFTDKDGVKKVNIGLQNRRKSEGELFSSQITDSVTVQQQEKTIKWTTTTLKSAQAKLLVLKLYTGKADGIWGPKTAAAIAMYANNNSISCGLIPNVEVPESFYNRLLNS